MVGNLSTLTNIQSNLLESVSKWTAPGVHNLSFVLVSKCSTEVSSLEILSSLTVGAIVTRFPESEVIKNPSLCSRKLLLEKQCRAASKEMLVVEIKKKIFVR